jgi:hypothetical protein
MIQKVQIIDGMLNKSINQKRTIRGIETSELINELAAVSELLALDIIDSVDDISMQLK